MQAIYNDERKFLADKAIQTHTTVSQESRIAFLKIQSWHFALRTPEIGRVYIAEAANMIQERFFGYIVNLRDIIEPFNVN